MIVAPDTSPRGSQVADDKEYDLGEVPGFMSMPHRSQWKAHYQMYDYILNRAAHPGKQAFRHIGKTGTVAKLAMRQPFVLFKGLTFQNSAYQAHFARGSP